MRTVCADRDERSSALLSCSMNLAGRCAPLRCAAGPEIAVVLGMERVFLEQKDNTKGHYIWGLRAYQALGIASNPSVDKELAVLEEAHATGRGACSRGPPGKSTQRCALQRHLRAGGASIKRCRLSAGRAPQGAGSTSAGKYRRGQPSNATRRGQSKPDPGSSLRPGATCSWPATDRSG